MDCRQKRRRGWVAVLVSALLPAGIGCTKSESGRNAGRCLFRDRGSEHLVRLLLRFRWRPRRARATTPSYRRIAKFDIDDQKHQESQVQDVRDLIETTRPDVLVLAPVAVNRAMQAVQVANDARVPVIIVNRDAEDPAAAELVSDQYFTTDPLGLLQLRQRGLWQAAAQGVRSGPRHQDPAAQGHRRRQQHDRHGQGLPGRGPGRWPHGDHLRGQRQLRLGAVLCGGQRPDRVELRLQRRLRPRRHRGRGRRRWR